MICSILFHQQFHSQTHSNALESYPSYICCELYFGWKFIVRESKGAALVQIQDTFPFNNLKYFYSLLLFAILAWCMSTSNAYFHCFDNADYYEILQTMERRKSWLQRNDRREGKLVFGEYSLVAHKNIALKVYICHFNQLAVAKNAFQQLQIRFEFYDFNYILLLRNIKTYSVFVAKTTRGCNGITCSKTNELSVFCDLHFFSLANARLWHWFACCVICRFYMSIVVHDIAVKGCMALRNKKTSQNFSRTIHFVFIAEFNLF